MIASRTVSLNAVFAGLVAVGLVRAQDPGARQNPGSLPGYGPQSTFPTGPGAGQLPNYGPPTGAPQGGQTFGLPPGMSGQQVPGGTAALPPGASTPLVGSPGTATGPDTGSPSTGASNSPGAGSGAPGTDTSQLPPGAYSRYQIYSRPWCCAPQGCNGPVGSELYVRTGPTLPVANGGGGILANRLSTGWMVQGGARVVFFDVPREKAWYIDMGVAEQENHGNQPDRTFDFLGRQASVRQLHRTTVNAGVGGFRYLLDNPAGTPGWTWRAGGDVGGRWGTARLDLNDPGPATGPQTGSNFSRRHDTIGAAYLALFTDFEYTCGCGCVFMGGFRAEFDYGWMDFIKQPGERGDMMDLNLLLTAGVRF